MSMSIPSIPAWKQLQNWHSSQQFFNDQLITDDAANIFATAQTNYSVGLSNLAARAALKRINAKREALFANLPLTTNLVDKKV